MTVNITDIADLISQEGAAARKYEELIGKAQNEGFRVQLSELRDLSVKKLNLLTEIIRDGPWGNWE